MTGFHSQKRQLTVVQPDTCSRSNFCRGDTVILPFAAEKSDVWEGEVAGLRSHSYKWLDLNAGLTLKPLCYMFLALKEPV